MQHAERDVWQFWKQFPTDLAYHIFGIESANFSGGFDKQITVHIYGHNSFHCMHSVNTYKTAADKPPFSKGGRRHQGASPFYIIFIVIIVIIIIVFIIVIIIAVIIIIMIIYIYVI